MTERKFVKNDHSTDRVLLKRLDTKKNRKDKYVKKRTAVQTVDNIEQIISSLNFNIESLPVLLKLLSHPNIDMYFSPCELHPEYKGPYIFPNEKPFQWLVSLLSHSDPTILRMVTGCFINISAHEKKGEWTNRLIPILPIFYKILMHGTPELKENIVWILANMCTDGPQTRDLILNQKVCDLICSIIDFRNWTIIACSANLLRALFIHRESLPNPENVLSLWNLMTKKILIEHFIPPIDVNVGILVDILRSINLLAKYSDPYKISIVQNKLLLERLVKYCGTDGLVQFLSAEILSTITELKETHVQMIVCIPTFVSLLGVPNPSCREEGGLAIANLSETGEALPALCTDLVLSAVRRQFDYSDISCVLKQMYFTINSIIITADEHNLQNDVYPIMIKFIFRICQSLMLDLMPNVVSHSIKALKCLCRWNLTLTRDLMEEFDALSRLDRLSNHENIEIQNIAEELVEILEC